MQQVFAPLLSAILTLPLGEADLHELIGNFAGTPGQGFIAHAMSFHARDILREHADKNAELIMPTNEVVAEVYRRTFFDSAAAELYGTQAIPEQGPQRMSEFAAYVTSSLMMDLQQQNSGFPSHPGSSASN